MGNFYTNITLRGPAQQTVAEHLRRQGLDAFVCPTLERCTTVCEQQCDTQDTEVLERLASGLSSQFGCPALAVLNHDDDILWYKLYERGQLLDEYDSTPGYFDGEEEFPEPRGGDARKLCAAFHAAERMGEVERALRAKSPDDYVFACERHADLARALGLPSFSVGLGYNYILEDELPEELSEENLIRTGEG